MSSRKYSYIVFMSSFVFLVMLFAGSCKSVLRDSSKDKIAGKNIDKQVEELLAKMTLSEKIGQMVQINDFDGVISDELKQRLRDGKIGSMLNEIVPEANLEIQRIAVEESRLGIPLIMARDVIHGYRTIFPIPLAQAATWDPNLAQACARIAAKEASSAGFQWTFAPMMDIARDPRWGRIAEGFGEDPYLGSCFAAAMVRGFQGDDLSSPDTIAACAKHYVGYGAAEGGRDYDTANIPESLLRNVYLPPFKAAVDAGVAAVMSAFNEINGIPATGNVHTLRDILKNEWGFDGFVVSDWKSTAEMMEHGFCEDMRDVAEKSIIAGIDMEMQSSAYGDYLEELVKEGAISEKLIDDAVRRILRIKSRLGLFEKPSIYSAKLPGKPNEEALALAKTTAMKSMVLLKNNDKLLPLSKDLKSIAIIGPLADDPYEVLGTWNRDGKPEDTITPLAAILDMIGGDTEINFITGLPYSRSKDTSEFAKAIELAKKSQIVLFFAGEESILSGEAHSRAYLNLPGAQDELIAELAKTDTPVVLVIFAGRPLTIGDIAEKIDAILYAWHPGTMTGSAVADLIFGIESPSGKLPITFPKTEGQIPIYYNHKNTGRPPEGKQLTMIDDIPLRAYQSSLGDAARYLDIGYKPLYPFGYGLSYTQFEYANLKLSSDKVKLGDNIKVSVDVTNTGDMEAEEVVQLYVRDLVASLTRPVKELKGFKRIRLKKNETKTVDFALSADSLGFHTNEGKYVVEAGKFHLWTGGSSEAELMTEFEIIE
ncbi:MAG: glycoside hydrolase family 3 C-terminal domain-containing protein [Sedimentisphaerales bacterium]|nr:glycoside hydrolase family 3 C-terminal domain-containing protein [Sedimentisphaerales bacterium]